MNATAIEEIKTALDSAFGGVKNRLTDVEQKLALLSEGGIGRGPAVESLASLLMKHDALEAFRNGAKSARAELTGIDVRKALVSTISDAANGYPVLPQQVLPAPLRPPRFWSSLASTPTGSNALQIIDMEATGGAAIQAKEGDPKAEMTNAASPRLVPVVTIPVHKTVSWQLFEDAPALQGFLQMELSESVNAAMDAYVVGALADVAQTYTPPAGGTALDSILNVIGALYGSGGSGVVVGLAPEDWIGLLTAKDSNGAYLVNPLQSLLTGIAGATIVPAASIGPGTFIAAASPAGAFVALRAGMSFEWSREHASNFTANLITLLVEMRGALVPQDPSLIYAGNLIAPVEPAAAKTK